MRNDRVDASADGVLDGEMTRLLEFASAEVGFPVSFTPVARGDSQRIPTPIGTITVPVVGEGALHGVLRCGSSGPMPTHAARYLVSIGRLVADRLDRRLAEATRLRVRVDRMKQMLANEELAFAYQPIINLQSGDMVGVEALARFKDTRRATDQWFIEAAAVGLGLELEVLAVRSAVAAFSSLPEDVYLSVNVSPEAAGSAELREHLRAVPLDRLVFEITEHDQVADYEALNEALKPLRARGLRLAVDDAGAGFASLRHILRIHPEIIKLDVSLIRDIDRDTVLRALSYSISAFGTAVDADVIAEGVETEGELNALRFLRVSYGQGFLLHEPVPLDAIRKPDEAVNPTIFA